MTKIRKPKQCLGHGRFWSLNIGICDLSFDFAQDGEPVEPFVIWSLEFVFLEIKLQGRAIIFDHAQRTWFSKTK